MFKAIVLTTAAVTLLLADGPVLKTGQTTAYYAGDDGTYKAGTPRSYTRDDTNGIVTDNATTLQWQDRYPTMLPGQIYAADWQGAIDYCSALDLDGSGWRLPSKHELKSIVDYSRTNPSLDSTYFQTVTPNGYWSSTTYAGVTTYAWGVNFNDGHGNLYDKTDSGYVRCVRGGQPL